MNYTYTKSKNGGYDVFVNGRKVTHFHTESAAAQHCENMNRMAEHQERLTLAGMFRRIGKYLQNRER